MSNYFRTSAVAGILAHVKKNPNITYENLVVKCGVRDPYVKRITAKNLIEDLIRDKQLSVNEKGEINIC